MKTHRKIIAVRYGIILAAYLALPACRESVHAAPFTPEALPLRALAAQAGLYIGATVQVRDWLDKGPPPGALWPEEGDPEYQRVTATEFNSITEENAFKWVHIQPEPGQFRWEWTDCAVDFAERHGQRVRGHVLIQRETLPWVDALRGRELLDCMEDHITRVVQRYRGRIHQWDVINEILADAPPGRDEDLHALTPESLIETTWKRETGIAFIEAAFRAARRADPDAALFYNDYFHESALPRAPCDPPCPEIPNAYDAMLCWKLRRAELLIDHLRAREEGGRPLIDGIGIQMHLHAVNHYRHDPACFTRRLRHLAERFTSRGVAVEITEMDVSLMDLFREYCDTPDIRPVATQEALALQAQIIRDVLGACLTVPGVSGVTFWGVRDRDSWLGPFFVEGFGANPLHRCKNHHVHMPLLFGDDPDTPDTIELLWKKPAYWAVHRVLVERAPAH